MKLHDSALFGETVALLDNRYEQSPGDIIAFEPQEVATMRRMNDWQKRTLFNLKKTFGNDCRLEA